MTILMNRILDVVVSFAVVGLARPRERGRGRWPSHDPRIMPVTS
jgi:hypothetical protein